MSSIISVSVHGCGTAHKAEETACETHLCFSVLRQVQLQWLDVVLETECHHRPQEIVAVDGLAFFTLAFVARSVN